MEASSEQNAEGLAIVRVLAAVLDRLVVANASIAVADPGQVTKFHAMKAPGIRILPYLERIHKYAQCSNECYILALIYIDRLIQRNNFLLTELNVHRVVITAVLLAAKFFDDAYYNNAYYAKIGGVLVSEMNGLEVDFLFRINFSLHVTPEIFDKYRNELWSHSANQSPTPTRLSPPVAPKPMHSSPVPMGMGHHLQTESMGVHASHITPSPPAGAGMNDNAMHIPVGPNDMMAGMQPPFMDFFHESGFMPLHRANSVPLQPKPAPVDTYFRSYASVPVQPVPYREDGYMDPAAYVSVPPAADAYNRERMMAGHLMAMSGAGM